jgi:hypothetical protein
MLWMNSSNSKISAHLSNTFTINCNDISRILSFTVSLARLLHSGHQLFLHSHLIPQRENIFLIIRYQWWGDIINEHRSSCKSLLYLSNFNQNWNVLTNICKNCGCGISLCRNCLVPRQTDMTTALRMHLKIMCYDTWDTRYRRKLWNERKILISENVHCKAKATWLFSSLNIQLHLEIFAVAGFAQSRWVC